MADLFREVLVPEDTKAKAGLLSDGFKRPCSLVAIGTAILVLRLVDVTGRGLGPSCAVHALTGLECPGCGGTRALQSMARGDLAKAANFNLLVVAAVPWAGWRYWNWLRHKERQLPIRKIVAPLIAGAVSASFFVLRNLETEPFVRLATGF